MVLIIEILKHIFAAALRETRVTGKAKEFNKCWGFGGLLKIYSWDFGDKKKE